MDEEPFDQLARRMQLLISRRVTLGSLVAAGLLSALDGLRHEVAAKRKRKKKKKKKPCKPESQDVTCTDSCGTIRNNCKQPVNCGECCEPESPGDTCGGNKCGFVTNNCGQSVDCSDCIVCQHCSAGTCQPDPDQRGDACGETGQVCLTNGACLCEAGTCGLGTVCLEGACRPCGFNEAPCCESGSCSGGLGCFGDDVRVCLKCGGTGEPCCPPGDTCLPSRICVNEVTCEDRGVLGLRCCANNSCSLGAICNTETQQCETTA